MNGYDTKTEPKRFNVPPEDKLHDPGQCTRWILGFTSGNAEGFSATICQNVRK